MPLDSPKCRKSLYCRYLIFQVLKMGWVFSGSFVGAQGDGRRVYGTDRSGIVIGIWRNSSAVIQYAKPTRNPYRGKNSGMAVNEDYVPNLGTPVKLVFYKYDPMGSVFEDD